MMGLPLHWPSFGPEGCRQHKIKHGIQACSGQEAAEASFPQLGRIRAMNSDAKRKQRLPAEGSVTPRRADDASMPMHKQLRGFAVWGCLAVQAAPAGEENQDEEGHQNQTKVS